VVGVILSPSKQTSVPVPSRYFLTKCDKSNEINFKCNEEISLNAMYQSLICVSQIIITNRDNNSPVSRHVCSPNVYLS